MLEQYQTMQKEFLQELQQLLRLFHLRAEVDSLAA